MSVDKFQTDAPGSLEHPTSDPISNNPHQGHRARLRDRFLHHGLEGFSDHQVLELLLFQTVPRGDTNPTAHHLLKRFGSLSGVLEADPADLATLPGIGSRTAAFLTLIPTLTRRYLHDRITRERPRLNDTHRVTDYLRPLMVGRLEEVFYLLCLDSQCRVLYPALLSEGTVKAVYVHPRQVVETALRHRAASVILAHNHPGGRVEPSLADQGLTRQLVEALATIDIRVLDHVVVAGEETYSFAEAGLLDHQGEKVGSGKGGVAASANHC